MELFNKVLSKLACVLPPPQSNLYYIPGVATDEELKMAEMGIEEGIRASTQSKGKVGTI